MRSEVSRKSTKTFPLEIEEPLHKRLKMKAIEEDKTLHSFIIDTLSAKMQEETDASKNGMPGGRQK
jgi:predicted HicB family RNase H-like nuclease